MTDTPTSPERETVAASKGPRNAFRRAWRGTRSRLAVLGARTRGWRTLSAWHSTWSPGRRVPAVAARLKAYLGRGSGAPPSGAPAQLDMFTRCPNCEFAVPGGDSLVTCEQCGQTLGIVGISAHHAFGLALRSIAMRAADTASPLLARAMSVIANISRERAWWGTLWLLVVLTLVNLAWTYRQPLLGQSWLRNDLAEWGMIQDPVATPFRNLDAIRLQSRQLQPHDTFAGILVLTATFISDAGQAQPWPALELSLVDSAGRLLARRQFSPRDYLDRAPTAGEWLQPGVLVPVRLDFADPGSDAAGFELRFR